MRVIIILLSLALFGFMLHRASLPISLLIALVFFVTAVLSFVFSMAKIEARDSGNIPRTAGRNTSFLAGLRDR